MGSFEFLRFSCFLVSHASRGAASESYKNSLRGFWSLREPPGASDFRGLKLQGWHGKADFQPRFHWPCLKAPTWPQVLTLYSVPALEAPPQQSHPVPSLPALAIPLPPPSIPSFAALLQCRSWAEGWRTVDSPGFLGAVRIAPPEPAPARAEHRGGNGGALGSAALPGTPVCPPGGG